ncbi:putative ferric-chelate reductase 1 [Astyanax mexicanus]|uniref:putative ferric-chelate reductase 1 n=1 Tax=Astyanax mexicanus TaxID=7994 RepID=UPI0020CA9D01|nr:putative ferric-chelate reductase 1 [Astyanax mexicanus]
MELLPKPWTLVVLFIVILRSVVCFSNGKVSQACGDMVPMHGYTPSPDPPPGSLTVDKTTFRPGDQIKVTFSSVLSDKKGHFKGFLIEARNARDPDAGTVGSFTLLNPAISQLLNCGDGEGSAVSHTSDSSKTEVQVMWTAPPDPPPNVQFLVTVVQKYKLYWVRVPGPVVTLYGASPLPPLSTAGQATSKTTTSSGTMPRPITSDGCGITKSCLREPAACDPQNDALCYFLSFAKEDDSVVFELSGPAPGYVSFALSTDKWMGEDDVYLCINEGSQVSINAAYVQGRTHPVIASENVLRDTEGRLVDGVIQCRFRRVVRIPAPNQNRSNLDEAHYLFMAHGRAENGRTHRHNRQPLISSNPVFITGSPEDLTGSRSPLLIKFHAVFMLIAWMTTVSTGVIIARYFKPNWPDTTLCGQRVWFQFHRALMLVTVLLTGIGFILPFIYRGGWSKRAGSHPYLGCTVMALALIQPIMALFRPAPDSSRRYIFNWLHLGTGTIAQVIAVVAVCLGIHQQALLLPAPWSTGIVAGYVIWFVLADLILEVHRRGLFPIGQFFKHFEVHTENIQTEDKEEILFVPSEGQSCIKGPRFKEVVLVVYLCGNLVFLTILLGTIRGV